MGNKARAIDWDRIANYIRASGDGAAQTGRTHDLHPTEQTSPVFDVFGL
jgi:hypothetical protein